MDKNIDLEQICIHPTRDVSLRQGRMSVGAEWAVPPPMADNLLATGVGRAEGINK